MASADLIINTLKDVAHSKNKEFEVYNDELCNSIKQKIDTKLREQNLSMADRAVFARNNYAVMNKWEQVFPAGISECLKEYFKSKALWAPRFDPRFPNTNQAKNCFVNFVDYQRCLKLKGADNKDCDYFKFASHSLCPAQWIEKFNEQLENGSFPVDV